MTSIVKCVTAAIPHPDPDIMYSPCSVKNYSHLPAPITIKFKYGKNGNFTIIKDYSLGVVCCQ